MWRLYFIFLATALAICSMGRQTMASPPPPDIAKTVTFVFLADEQGNPRVQNGTPVAIGTGFFVFVENEAGGPGGHGYLVTAKHVLRNDAGAYLPTVCIRMNDKNGGSQFLRLDLRPEGPQKNVFEHGDATVDIAVVAALPSQELFDFLAFPTNLIKSKEEFKKSTIRPGSDVFFAGLFAPHYGEKVNSPIFRFGRVAMLPEDRIRWQEVGKQPEQVELYLLETMSFGGNSGSPVFFSQGMDRVPGQIILGGDEITLAGVMRGNFNEPRPGALVQTPNAVLPIFAQNIGIAAVTPGYLLREILYSSEVKAKRSEIPIRPDAKP